MPVSEEIGRIIMTGGSVLDIKEQAVREGVWGLRQSALHKVKQGITSLDEINRVTVD
jgi:type IV pilus assembly protein PilB